MTSFSTDESCRLLILGADNKHSLLGCFKLSRGEGDVTSAICSALGTAELGLAEGTVYTLSAPLIDLFGENVLVINGPFPYWYTTHMSPWTNGSRVALAVSHLDRIQRRVKPGYGQPWGNDWLAGKRGRGRDPGSSQSRASWRTQAAGLRADPHYFNNVPSDDSCKHEYFL